MTSRMVFQVEKLLLKPVSILITLAPSSVDDNLLSPRNVFALIFPDFSFHRYGFILKIYASTIYFENL